MNGIHKNSVIIQQLTKQILNNIRRINSLGLYNGKAGFSLSLFLASRFLQDENIEEKACNLIKESLVGVCNDNSFENGSAGIGYALLYLIENNYIEADFKEIFHENYQLIINNFEHIDKDPLNLITSFKVIYFLSKVKCVLKKEECRIQSVIQKIIEGLELFLIIQFNDFEDINYINRKADVLKFFETYLKIVDYSDYKNFSHLLLNDYMTLYHNGKILSSLETGYYLNKVTNRNKIIGYEETINEIIHIGLKSIYPGTLSLKERIDLTQLINRIKKEERNNEDKLFNMNIKDEDFQNTIISDNNFDPFGYGAGLSRLLIFYIDNNIELL